ncbi:MAG TPA: hypothetical protein DD473_21220 [Planctomycetaceae bacterium]|nr:hypothetical protein [Planctomycetaceae bacterium]
MSETTIISLDQLRAGIVLPSPIFDGQHENLLLIGKGIQVTQQYLNRLAARGICSVAIESSFADQIRKPQGASLKSIERILKPKPASHSNKALRAENPQTSPLSQQIHRPHTLEYDESCVTEFKGRRAAAGATLAQFLQTVDSSGIREGRQIRGMAVDSIESLMVDMDLFVKLAIDPAELADEYSHCVRVSELAMAIAAVLEYPRNKIEELGIGCLIYKAAENRKLDRHSEQKHNSNEKEQSRLQQNPYHLYESLEAITDLPIGARQVAYQIHERWDGSGAPRQRYGNQIHPLARIAGVAEEYVALTTHQDHRRAIEPYQVIEIMLDLAKNRKFEPKVIKALLQTVCLYPLGSYVQLNDGTIAVVVRSNLKAFDRPIVKMLYDSKGQKVPTTSIDLSIVTRLHVTQAMDSERVKKMSNGSSGFRENLLELEFAKC